MKKIRLSKRSIIIVWFLSAFFIVGCSSQLASSIRKVTYPPDFTYTEQADLRSDMKQLGYQMALLDTALVPPTYEGEFEAEIQREKVIGILQNMGKIASRLQAGKSGANHPFMDDYMQGFISELDTARTAASLQPPRYYFAGKISGGCTSCHKVNR